MQANRSTREALKRQAPAIAARLAADTWVFDGAELVVVADPMAVGALFRAFRMMIRAAGQPVALPISRAEALAFPANNSRDVPGSVYWLAVGVNVSGKATSSVQCVSGPVKAVSHELARTRALAAVADGCAFRRPE